MKVEHNYDKSTNQLKLDITISPRKMAFQKRVSIRNEDVLLIAEKLLSDLKEKFINIKLLSGDRIHNEGRLTGTWVFLVEKKEAPKPVKKEITKPVKRETPEPVKKEVSKPVKTEIVEPVEKKPVAENTTRKPQEQRRKFEVDFGKNRKDS